MATDPRIVLVPGDTASAEGLLQLLQHLNQDCRHPEDKFKKLSHENRQNMNPH